MEPDIEEQNESTEADKPDEQTKEILLCLKCARPVDPLSHYCPHCGEATGQLTPYIPFVNLRMQINFWVQMWYQVWSGEISFVGRCFRLVMIILLFPILLLVFIAVSLGKLKRLFGRSDQRKEK